MKYNLYELRSLPQGTSVSKPIHPYIFIFTGSAVILIWKFRDK